MRSSTPNHTNPTPCGAHHIRTTNPATAVSHDTSFSSVASIASSATHVALPPTLPLLNLSAQPIWAGAMQRMPELQPSFHPNYPNDNFGRSFRPPGPVMASALNNFNLSLATADGISDDALAVVEEANQYNQDRGRQVRRSLEMPRQTQNLYRRSLENRTVSGNSQLSTATAPIPATIVPSPATLLDFQRLQQGNMTAAMAGATQFPMRPAGVYTGPARTGPGSRNGQRHPSPTPSADESNLVDQLDIRIARGSLAGNTATTSPAARRSADHRSPSPVPSVSSSRLLQSAYNPGNSNNSAYSRGSTGESVGSPSKRALRQSLNGVIASIPQGNAPGKRVSTSGVRVGLSDESERAVPSQLASIPQGMPLAVGPAKIAVPSASPILQRRTVTWTTPQSAERLGLNAAAASLSPTAQDPRALQTSPSPLYQGKPKAGTVPYNTAPMTINSVVSESLPAAGKHRSPVKGQGTLPASTSDGRSLADLPSTVSAPPPLTRPGVSSGNLGSSTSIGRRRALDKSKEPKPSLFSCFGLLFARKSRKVLQKADSHPKAPTYAKPGADFIAAA